MQAIIEKLNSVKGLRIVAILNRSTRAEIAIREDIRNTGVFEVLARKKILLLAHDSSFREPASEIVKKEDNSFVLPAVPFPEIDAADVVSSSPSAEVHEFLIKKLGLSLAEEEATLLVGFN